MGPGTSPSLGWVMRNWTNTFEREWAQITQIDENVNNPFRYICTSFAFYDSVKVSQLQILMLSFWSFLRSSDDFFPSLAGTGSLSSPKFSTCQAKRRKKTKEWLFLWRFGIQNLKAAWMPQGWVPVCLCGQFFSWCQVKNIKNNQWAR